MKSGIRLLCTAMLFATLIGSPEVSAAGPVARTANLQLKSVGLVDFRGRRWELKDFADDKCLIFAFLGTECPLAKLYAERLQRLADEYAPQSVRVVAVMSNRQDSLEEIAAFARRQELEYTILKDAGNRFADQVGAKRTPEVFLYDQNRSLRYQGRVDDQYGIGYVRDEPRRRDLRLALDEVLAGKDVSESRTDGVGCIIGRSKTVDQSSDVTYGGQVAAILNKHCVQCHREDELAPFALTEYDEVAGWADMIAEVVKEERMPPWHASPEHGEFANERRLTSEEKQILYDWAEAGAPAGDLSDLPEVPVKVVGWQLPRDPDRIIPVSPKPFEVPATGAVEYRYFSFDPEFEEDKWLAAAEIRPGNREVVHHILVFAVPKGRRRGLDGARDFLVGYVPGARVEKQPAGYAKRIPAGSELIFQVHYTPIGTKQLDQSELGLVFADPNTITHEIKTFSAVQPVLRISPGDEAYTTYAASIRKFPEGAELLSVSPHMHVRGKAFRYQLETPDGKRETLIDIPRYDFNWQTTYVFDKPLKPKPGSRILCTAVFDNSENNLSNPGSDKTVRWGDQTWDEMMIGYYHYSVPHDPNESPSNLQRVSREERELGMRDITRMGMFTRLDRDADGKISRKDAPSNILNVFDELDQNGDKVLTREEVAFSK